MKNCSHRLDRQNEHALDTFCNKNAHYKLAPVIRIICELRGSRISSSRKQALCQRRCWSSLDEGYRKVLCVVSAGEWKGLWGKDVIATQYVSDSNTEFVLSAIMFMRGHLTKRWRGQTRTLYSSVQITGCRPAAFGLLVQYICGFLGFVVRTYDNFRSSSVNTSSCIYNSLR